MKRFLIAIVLCLLWSSQGSTSDNINFSKIDDLIAHSQTIDSSTLSEEEFYQYENAIFLGFSGSGGYFLGEDLIDWLKKGEVALDAKGIELKNEDQRHLAFADSYFHEGKLEKALAEYRNMHLQGGVEKMEWFIDNKGIKNGIVKIKESPGKIPYGTSEIASAENKQYLFVSYFKGPIYRFNKTKTTHAIIYAPENRYDWCDALYLDGEKTMIRLRDGAGTFVFDNSSQEIQLQ